MELHTYILFYTMPDLPYVTSIGSSSLICISAPPWQTAYSGRELWGLKELHESSSYLSRSHSGGCRRYKAQETSYAIQAFAMLCFQNIPVFWRCFSGISNLHDLVCLVYILDKLSLWSCFLPMLFLCEFSSGFNHAIWLQWIFIIALWRWRSSFCFERSDVIWNLNLNHKAWQPLP